MNRFIVLLLFVLSTGCTATARPVLLKARQDVWCGPGWQAELSMISVSQHVEDTCIEPRRYRKTAPLDPTWWETLNKLLAENDFEHLPPLIEQEPDENGKITVVTDADRVCIELRTGRTREVCGFTTDIALSRDGERFTAIWNHILAALPEKGIATAMPPDLGLERTKTAPPPSAGPPD